MSFASYSFLAASCAFNTMLVSGLQMHNILGKEVHINFSVRPQNKDAVYSDIKPLFRDDLPSTVHSVAEEIFEVASAQNGTVGLLGRGNTSYFSNLGVMTDATTAQFEARLRDEVLAYARKLNNTWGKQVTAFLSSPHNRLVLRLCGVHSKDNRLSKFSLGAVLDLVKKSESVINVRLFMEKDDSNSERDQQRTSRQDSTQSSRSKPPRRNRQYDSAPSSRSANESVDLDSSSTNSATTNTNGGQSKSNKVFIITLISIVSALAMLALAVTVLYFTGVFQSCCNEEDEEAMIMNFKGGRYAEEVKGLHTLPQV